MDQTRHPILEHPEKYRIAAIRIEMHIPGSGFIESSIDLTLHGELTVRRLRFLRPRDLVVPEGFLTYSSFPVIEVLDVRRHYLEDIRVQVVGYEPQDPPIRFYAAEVIDLDRNTSM